MMIRISSGDVDPWEWDGSLRRFLTILDQQKTCQLGLTDRRGHRWDKIQDTSTMNHEITDYTDLLSLTLTRLPAGPEAWVTRTAASESPKGKVLSDTFTSVPFAPFTECLRKKP